MGLSEYFYLFSYFIVELVLLLLYLSYRQERNIIEAASFGASTAVPLVLNIGANLIAFLALLALFNGILGFIGGLVGYPELSFEVIALLNLKRYT